MEGSVGTVLQEVKNYSIEERSEFANLMALCSVERAALGGSSEITSCK